MRFLLQLFTALACLLVLGACERSSQQQSGIEESDVSIIMVMASDPAIVGATQLRFTILDPDKQPVDGASLAVKGNMNHAGMVPVIANTAESVEGVYGVPFEWTMGGDWFVKVVATLPDGRIVSKSFEVSVASAADGANP